MFVPEQQLESSLKQFEEHWELNPGDGAFYGPKVRLAERKTFSGQTLHEKFICHSVQKKLVKQNDNLHFPSYIHIILNGSINISHTRNITADIDLH